MKKESKSSKGEAEEGMVTELVLVLVPEPLPENSRNKIITQDNGSQACANNATMISQNSFNFNLQSSREA